MSRPLPIIRLPSTPDGRAAFWRYVYAHGFSWAEWSLDYTLGCLDTYESWSYVYLDYHDRPILRYTQSLTDHRAGHLTFVNSASHLVSYAKRLGAPVQP